jgi:hypothetical protein
VNDSALCVNGDHTARIEVPDALTAWLEGASTLFSRGEVAAQSATFQQAQRQASARIQRDEQRRQAIILSLGFTDGTPCVSAPLFTAADIDVDKSLFVHDRATIDAGNFTLGRTLQQLANQAVAAGAAGIDANLLFQRFWDPQTSPGVVSGGAQCTDNGGTLNGFPLDCRPFEGGQAANPALMAQYRPIALVNRLDLAHEGWRNCGEYRIVYGRQRTPNGTNSTINPFTPDRAFVIFEAVLPNPRPGCRSGCQPVATFWASLSRLSAVERAAELEKFFYQGLPGFRPVVHIDHYTGLGASSFYGASGGGQIRTNEKLRGEPWSLREFHLALTCGSSPCPPRGAILDVVPTMTKVNPYGWLWSQEVGTGALLTRYRDRAIAFQAEVQAQVSSLGQDDFNKFGYAVSLDFDAAESKPPPGGIADDYVFTFTNSVTGGSLPPGGFHSNLSTAAAGLTPALSGDQLVRRALANSCAGCHNPGLLGLTQPNALGPPGSNVTSFPPSLALSPGVVTEDGFAHTSEVETAGIHEISPALQNYFLPARRQFLLDQLNAPSCPCERTFSFLTPARRQRAFTIERSVIEDFAPRIAGSRQMLRQRLAMKEIDRAEVARLRQETAALEAQQDSETVRLLAKSGNRVARVSVDQRAQIMKVDTRSAKGAQARQALVTQAVLAALKREPPRRTVTGSFRVH